MLSPAGGRHHRSHVQTPAAQPLSAQVSAVAAQDFNAPATIGRATTDLTIFRARTLTAAPSPRTAVQLIAVALTGTASADRVVVSAPVGMEVPVTAALGMDRTGTTRIASVAP